MAKSMTGVVKFGRSIDDAWALITDSAYQEAKLASAGARNVAVTITPNADGSTTVVLDRENPVEGVPGAIKKLVGDWAHVIETQNWGAPGADGSRTGTHGTEFVGQKLKLSGTLMLNDSGDGAAMTINSDVKADIPLIGGKVEDTTIEQTKAAIENENKLLEAYGR